MRMLEAFDATLELARERGMLTKTTHPDLSLVHLVDMRSRIDPDNFSPAKVGRWLGWAQAAVVAAGCASLDDMKQLNKRFAG